MPSLSVQLLEMLTEPGPRLPKMGGRLLRLWASETYPHSDPVQFLQSRESEVNQIEGLISSAAWHLYDEFQVGPPADRNILNFLTDERPSAAVVFDGLSLRELPAIFHLATESGLSVIESGFSLAAIPSETVDFVAQRLLLPSTSPSALPTRRELKERGIRAYYLSSQAVREQFDRDADALLVWSAFPDVTYKDSGARFAQHFAQLDATFRQAWMNTVQAIPAGRKLLITSDHGYVFFGPGLSFPRRNEELVEIQGRFRGQRNAKLPDGEKPLVHKDVAVMQIPGGGRVMMLRGRVQTHPPGEQANRLYKHGGLSLMEMLTPWVVLQS